MGQPSDAGFSADLDGITWLANFSSDTANGVRADQSKLNAEAFHLNENPFGDDDALATYEGFFTAWAGELAVIAGSLDELGEKFTATAKTYQDNEVKWAHDFQDVGNNLRVGRNHSDSIGTP